MKKLLLLAVMSVVSATLHAAECKQNGYYNPDSKKNDLNCPYGTICNTASNTCAGAPLATGGCKWTGCPYNCQACNEITGDCVGAPLNVCRKR